MRFSNYLAISFLTITATTSLATAGDLAAYRAFYALEPQRVERNAPQVPLDGAMAYEMRGSDCLGYALDSRFATRYIDGERGAKTIDMRSTTFESADGLDFEINQKQTMNSASADDERISVRRERADGNAEGQLSGSRAKTFKLDAKSLFPTVYEKKLLAAAMQGQTRDDSLIYDGSDGEKQYRAITFIGKKRQPGSYLPDVNNPAAQALAGLSSWPFSIGYYNLDNKNAEVPDFQASFNIYENGVTTEMVFDYGTYALKGRLEKLEMLAAQPCNGADINPLGPPVGQPQ